MRVIFMGTPDFAVPVLNELEKAAHEIVLAVTQPDRPKGRGKAMAASPVKQWALARGIPVFQPQRIRDEAAVSELMRYPADIGITAAFGQILPKELLEHPSYGCINVHASLLPKYRGASPIQWSIINGDDVTGVTIMQMGEGLDDGDILLQQEVPIDPADTGGSLFDKLSVCGGVLCTEALQKIETGRIAPVPQDGAQATHVTTIQKELGKADFSMPAAKLERMIRALDPWPGVYTSLGTKILKLWKAQVLPDDAPSKTVPFGTVVYTDKTRLVVKTGEGCLSLLEVQPASKKRMGIADFLRGYNVAVGDVLG